MELLAHSFTHLRLTAMRVIMAAVLLLCASCALPGADDGEGDDVETTTNSLSVSANAAEAEFHERLNSYRANSGRGALQRDRALDHMARTWSASMRGRGVLSHNPALSAQVAMIEPAWLGAAENVGVGGDVPGLHAAFIASPGHRVNMVGDYNRVGVGVVVEQSRLWVTFVFLRGPAITVDGAAAPTQCGRLSAGQGLRSGQQLASCDGRFALAMQADGNLVLYHHGTALWSSSTYLRGGVLAVMQGDGNLVVYRSSGSAVWSSRTHGNPGAFFALQNDGNAVVYRSNGVAVWNSRTCCR